MTCVLELSERGKVYGSLALLAEIHLNMHLNITLQVCVTYVQELTELSVVYGSLPLLTEVHLDKLAVKVKGNFLVESRLLDHLNELLCGQNAWVQAVWVSG